MDEKNEKSVLTDDAEEKIEPEILEADHGDEVNSDDVSSDEGIVEKITNEVEQLRQEKDEMVERNLRLQAEYDNFKKRTQREKIAERKYRSQEIVTELLPALDNFDRALEVEVTKETKSIIEGISMVYKQINDVLQSEDVEVIETVGKSFDPNLHHAVIQAEDSDYESNVVVEELQKGYILKDRVIRPAMVKVNK